MKVLNKDLFFIIFIFWPTLTLAKTEYSHWGDYNQFTVPLFSLGLSWYKTTNKKRLSNVAPRYETDTA